MAHEFARNRQDAAVNPAAFALPGAGSSTTLSSAIDLGTTNPKLMDIELQINAPALNVTQLPNGETVTYGLHDSADDSTYAALMQAVVVQTGAGGAGAVAVTSDNRVKIPSNANRYIKVYATTSAGTGSCAAASCTATVRF